LDLRYKIDADIDHVAKGAQRSYGEF